jgi:hypothetical protein
MNKSNKEDIIKKWAPILNSMGVTGSKADWMSQYVEMHSKNESKVEENTTVNDNFFFPVAMRAASQTIGMDLVGVQPMAYPSWVKQEVRSKKIKSILEKITI